MDKKMTYTAALDNAIQAVNSIIAHGADNDDMHETINKLTALKEQLTKRNTAKSDKPTKTQRENAEVKARILEFLTHTLQGLRCGEIANEIGISGQKCSALLKQLVDAGKVVKREGEKRVTLFLLPENDMTDPANS